jgi:hypothetical protein
MGRWLPRCPYSRGLNTLNPLPSAFSNDHPIRPAGITATWAIPRNGDPQRDLTIALLR